MLRNACRHQNMPVIGTPSGNCRNFRCRFHGWTYDLDGRFLSAPPPVAPPAARTDRDLASLAMMQAAGLVFFSMGKPASRPQLAPDPPAYGGTAVTEIDCNWKVCVEHLLARQHEYHWPLLALRRTASSVVVEQIVPHTFLRTRLFTHVFGTKTADAAGADSGPSIKQACERLQAERAGGVMPREAEFHRRIAVAAA